MKLLNKVLLALSLLACTVMAQAQSPSTVLVVGNANSKSSVGLVTHYMKARNISRANMLLLNWDANDNADTCSLAQYNTSIAAPVYNKIAQLGGIDYIVLCRNLPIRVRDNSNSVDSMLAGKSTQMRFNPYYNSRVPFTSARFGIYLVTRLDGWSWDDALALVNRSMAATRGTLFAFDCDPSKDSNSGYKWFNDFMKMGAAQLQASGLSIDLDNTATFRLPTQPVAGYMSWGSNDSQFSAVVYNSLRFEPGAIVETAVSTSGSNIRFPGGGQSQIAQLVRNGVTGIKGYVAEPFLRSVAMPNMLFRNYTSGLNLAESFYASSSFLGWKDVVLGDPLCAPYKQ